MRIERSRRDDARKHSGSSSAVGAFAKGVADGFFTQKKSVTTFYTRLRNLLNTIRLL